MNYRQLEKLTVSGRLGETADAFCGLAGEETGAEHAVLFIKKKGKEILEFFRRNEKGLLEAFEVPISEKSFAGWSFLYDEKVFTEDAADDERYDKALQGITPAPRNLTSVPIKSRGSVTGVLILLNLPGLLDNNTMDLLDDYSESLNFALEFTRQKENFDSLLKGFQEFAVTAVDGVTMEGPGHVMRVTLLATELAVLLDLSERAKRKLWKAAVFHDLGKVILQNRKPWEVDRFHTVEGAGFISTLNLTPDFSSIILESHERYDGTGFPDGLSGDEISHEGSLLALAEDFEEWSFTKKNMLFDDMAARFFEQRADSHNPEGVEALASLYTSGNLEKMMRG